MAESLGKKTIQDFKEDIYRCSYECFNCTIFSPEFLPSCPAYEKFGFNSYASRGRSGIMESYLAGNITLSEDMAQIFYACSLCGACRVCCQQSWKDYNLEAFIAMREELLENGFAPANLRDALKSLQKYSNPFSMLPDTRSDWAKGLEIEEYSQQEYLLYIGDEGSFDLRGQKMARDLVKILQKADISFGTLGNKENTDGYEVKVAGEAYLFEYIVQSNIKMFDELGVKKVIALSPHAYHTMKHDYPLYGAKFEVCHYTQLLMELIKEGKIKPSLPFRHQAFYHDPCYLGRFNDEYDTPRDVLRSIPGLELIDLPRQRDKAFCCGGGGANLYTDSLTGGKRTPGRMRINEIVNGGADIAVIACPICAMMLDDAANLESLEDRIKVMDIAEILLLSLEP